MTLTDENIKSLKPRTRAYKLSIGKGAYLLVKPGGRKYWRLKYHLNGKEGIYSLGVFPGVSVDAAKATRDSVKEFLLMGIKPAARHKEKVKATSAEPVFRMGLSKKAALSIVTDTHVMTFTPQRTQALAIFLAANLRKDNEPF